MYFPDIFPAIPPADESPADESAGYARASLTGRGRREGAGHLLQFQGLLNLLQSTLTLF